MRLVTATALLVAPMAAAETSAWEDVTAALWPGEVMRESGLVALEAPGRAQDAALVPMTISTALPEGDPRRVERVTLVVDENPSPVAATFTLGEEAEVGSISTRVRIDAYTPVHVVARLSDGSLHVAERFVKGSGGCSAPAVKDPEEAMASLGLMRWRSFGTEDGVSEAQIAIRHPNTTGLQRDPLTLYPIPAHFVQEVEITQGGAPILTMEGGISISEDPSFRFTYRSTGEPVEVRAVDTEGAVFEGDWPGTQEGT